MYIKHLISYILPHSVVLHVEAVAGIEKILLTFLPGKETLPQRWVMLSSCYLYRYKWL